jgi:hypothetical protein
MSRMPGTRPLSLTEHPCSADTNRSDPGSGANLGMVPTHPRAGSLPAPCPRTPEPAHPGHPGGPGDYRGQLPPGSRGVTVHDPDHPLPHTTARRPLCREVPGLPARHAGRPGRVFPAAARRKSPEPTGFSPRSMDFPRNRRPGGWAGPAGRRLDRSDGLPERAPARVGTEFRKRAGRRRSSPFRRSRSVPGRDSRPSRA